MPGAAKKRPTEAVKVTVGSGRSARSFAIPASQKREVVKFITSCIKQAALEKSVPAEKILPELADDSLRPAAMLRGARYKAQLTQAELAAKLAIRQHHLSEMENAKRPIGRDMARRLAVVLKCDYRLFL